MLAGFAVDEELQNLVASGLSHYEALLATTSWVTESRKASDEWGRVATGRRSPTCSR